MASEKTSNTVTGRETRRNGYIVPATSRSRWNVMILGDRMPGSAKTVRVSSVGREERD